MLSFGNKEFRNLQEQVLENMKNIQNIKEGSYVLDEFGIKVVAQVESVSDIPTVGDYKTQNPDWEYGDAYAVGVEAPYELYILTREGGIQSSDYWFDIGQFPVAGPQGEQGPQGETGATPAVSMTVGSVTTIQPGQSASASVSTSGTAAAPVFTLSFNIPQGAAGIQGPQGPQGQTGPQGPQGIQGEKGDQGFLYTIVGQVSASSSLPTPSTVDRDSAYLVGAHEPYDVYVIMGDDPADLQWINLGAIATIAPNVYIASLTYATSGTLDSPTLTSILNETGMHYLKDGNIFFGFSNKDTPYYAYYTANVYDNSSQLDNIYRITVDLYTGAWTVSTSAIPDTSGFVTTGTSQTITAQKTIAQSASGIRFAGATSPTPKDDNIIQNVLGEFNVLVGSGQNFVSNLRVGASEVRTATLSPLSNQANYDLGTVSNPWNSIYLHGDINISGTTYDAVIKNVSNMLTFYYNSVARMYISNSNIMIASNLTPSMNGIASIGSKTYAFNSMYANTGYNIIGTGRSWLLGKDGDYNFSIKSTTDGTTFTEYYKVTTSAILPMGTYGTQTLGSVDNPWSDIFTNGNIKFTKYSNSTSSVAASIYYQQYLGEGLNIKVGSEGLLITASNTQVASSTLVTNDVVPLTTGTNDLGSSTKLYRNLYLSGTMTNGTNSVDILGIANGLVEANPTVPSGTTPTALTGLKVGANYYEISGGGGGSSYKHDIHIVGNNNNSWLWDFHIYFSSSSSTPVTTISALKALCVANSYARGYYPCNMLLNGVVYSSTSTAISQDRGVASFLISNTTTPALYIVTSASQAFEATTISTFTDTVS